MFTGKSVAGDEILKSIDRTVSGKLNGGGDEPVVGACGIVFIKGVGCRKTARTAMCLCTV